MDKKHLNKIVGYLLDDIEIHYDYQSVQIIGSDIEYDIERLSDYFFGKVWDILEYDYSLNTDECLYVYGNLLYQINIKMKDYGSINESVDNKKIYLDKIVQYIIDDTVIDYDNTTLQLIGSDKEYDIEFLGYSDFYDMIDYKLEFDYGLNPNDCLYVYGNLLYQINKKMKDYGSINESINSRGDYLNKIVEYLLEDTEIDYNNRSVNLLFLHPPMLLYFFPYPLPSPILEYCKDVYGLNDDETNYVLREYKNTIVDKINNLPINESVDNKKIYLDKIVQYILDDTKLDYGRKEVIYPFIPNVRSQWGLLVPLYYVQYDSPFFNEYSKYCNDMYGLSYEESVYVWDHYKTRLIDKGSINESVDSKKIYLDKILDYIVEDTMINSRDWEPPFHLRKYLHSLPTPQYLFPYFYKYCNDNYGLTNDEVRSLWEPYLDRVDKLSRKKPY